LYIADAYNNRVRQVSSGTITTIAGNGLLSFSRDGGSATSALLDSPNGLALDSNGSLYIADGANHRIRKISGGVITTIAGDGNAGFSGDGGSAVNASLNFPGGIAIDSAGNLYFADVGNNRDVRGPAFQILEHRESICYRFIVVSGSVSGSVMAS
jgi:DNA-binding beta-propeller fold protein YncE